MHAVRYRDRTWTKVQGGIPGDCRDWRNISASVRLATRTLTTSGQMPVACMPGWKLPKDGSDGRPHCPRGGHQEASLQAAPTSAPVVIMTGRPCVLPDRLTQRHIRPCALGAAADRIGLRYAPVPGVGLLNGMTSICSLNGMTILICLLNGMTVLIPEENNS